MSIAAEVCSRAILNHIYKKVEKKLRPFQARFRRGRSCAEQMQIIRHILEEYHQKNLPLVLTFIILKRYLTPSIEQ